VQESDMCSSQTKVFDEDVKSASSSHIYRTVVLNQGARALRWRTLKV